MGYFTYLADQAFKTGENGETLFFLGGPWSRPIVIEGEGKTSRTYTKHLWMQRGFMGTLIIGQAVLFAAYPKITHAALGFSTYLLGMLLLHGAIQRIVFRRELKECRRLAKRVPLRRFYKQMAERHTSEGLFLGLLICILFVACGVWMLFDPSSGQRFIGGVCCVFFGACGVAWGYAWRLKSRTPISTAQTGDFKLSPPAAPQLASSARGADTKTTDDL